MTAAAFCTIPITTKRVQVLGTNLRGSPVEYLTGLFATPLWSLRPETIETLGISSPREYKELYIVPTGDTLPDIVEGDLIVHSGTQLLIDHVAEWPDLSGGIPTLQIVVTEVKQAWPAVTP